MPVFNCRFLSLILSTLLVSHGFPSASAQDESEPVRQTKRIRRVLYNFDGTKVTDAGVAELQKALPDCEITH